MEWLKKLIEKHTKDEKLDTEALMKDVKNEFPKVAVPKDKYNELAETKKKLDEGISDRDNQLEELKKTASASEDMKKQIETLQNDNKAAKEKHEAEMKDLTLTNAIKLAVADKAHDEGLVAGLIDKSKLIINEDKVTGLDEQLKELQKSKSFLFKPVKEEPEDRPGFQGKVGGDGKGTGTASDEQLAEIFGNTAQKT